MADPKLQRGKHKTQECRSLRDGVDRPCWLVGHGGEEEEDWTATVRVRLEQVVKVFPITGVWENHLESREPEEDSFPLGRAECQGAVVP